MKKNKFIPKEIEMSKSPIVDCFKCIHRNKCVWKLSTVTRGCGSFNKKAGIRK